MGAGGGEGRGSENWLNFEKNNQKSSPQKPELGDTAETFQICS